MFLDYFALGLLFFVAFTLFYGIIAVHDIPYEISVKRNHPHQDAIHIAGWVSLFTLHVLWPFLWIWATLWREDRGWGFARIKDEQLVLHHKVLELEELMNELQAEIRGKREAGAAEQSATDVPAATETASSRDAKEGDQ